MIYHLKTAQNLSFRRTPESCGFVYQIPASKQSRALFGLKCEQRLWRCFAGMTMLMVFCLFISSPAMAEYYYWKDPVHQFSLSYPDTWERVLSQKSDEALTIMAPSAKDGKQNFAACRMRVRAEPRYKIYPARFGDNNNRDLFTKDFWEGYLAENVGYNINDHRTNAGLGRHFASMVHANYVSFDDPGQQKQAVIFASLYNNKVYLIDCSSTIETFQSFYPQFMSIIKSVGFRKEIHEVPNGEYRPFLSDCKTWVRNGPDTLKRRDMYLKKYW